MLTVLATPVSGSLVKNQSRVCHLFPATYVPRLRGGASKLVQCKAELVSFGFYFDFLLYIFYESVLRTVLTFDSICRMIRRAQRREIPLVTKRYMIDYME